MEIKQMVLNSKLNNGGFTGVLSGMKKLPDSMGMQFLGARTYSNNGSLNHTVFFNKEGISWKPTRNVVSKIGLFYTPKTDELILKLEHPESIDGNAVLQKAKEIIVKYGQLLD